MLAMLASSRRRAFACGVCVKRVALSVQNWKPQLDGSGGSGSITYLISPENHVGESVNEHRRLDAAVSQLILGISRQGQPAQNAQAGKHGHSSEHGRYAIMIGKPPHSLRPVHRERRCRTGG